MKKKWLKKIDSLSHAAALKVLRGIARDIIIPGTSINASVDFDPTALHRYAEELSLPTGDDQYN